MPSVICPCSATWSWASVARIDRDVKISAMTAARPGNAVTEICIQSRGSRVVTELSRRAHLGSPHRRVAERSARSDDEDDRPVRPVRLEGGICLSKLMRRRDRQSRPPFTTVTSFVRYCVAPFVAHQLEICAEALRPTEISAADHIACRLHTPRSQIRRHKTRPTGPPSQPSDTTL